MWKLSDFELRHCHTSIFEREPASLVTLQVMSSKEEGEEGELFDKFQ